MTTIRLIECAEPSELFHQYPSQQDPQPVNLELDLAEGTWQAVVDGEPGTAVPMQVYRGIVRRYPVPVLTAAAANRELAELAEAAQRVADDASIKPVDGDRQAVLGEQARHAEAEIRRSLGLDEEYDMPAIDGVSFADSDLVAIWGIEGSITGEEVEEYGITGSTTDEELERIAAEITRGLAGVSDSGVAVCPEVLPWLVERRDELAEQDEA